MRIHTDHRNVAYIFNPEACVSSVAKTNAQHFDQWQAVLGQYDYTVEHIPGERNYWGGLLSRWVTVPSVSVRAAAVYVPSEPDHAPPTKEAIREVQQESLAFGSLAASATSFTTESGEAMMDGDGLFRSRVDDRAGLWIPEDAAELQARLMVCAHMRDPGLAGRLLPCSASPSTAAVCGWRIT